MKRFILFLIVSIVISCSCITKSISQKKGTLHVIGGGIIGEYSSLSADFDTVRLIEKSCELDSCFSLQITYKSKDTIPFYSFTTRQMSYAIGILTLSKMKSDDVYIDQINEPKLKYNTPPENVYQTLINKNVVTKQTRFMKYNSRYYFTELGASKYFYIYDETTEILYNLDYPTGDYLNLRDFFLYNLSGSDVPQIFLFSDGLISRTEKDIAIDILSVVIK